MRASAILVPALAFSTALGGDLKAQNVALDEGAFLLSIHGQLVGREEFSIRRAGVGEQARVILRGTVELDLPDGERNLAPALEAGGPTLAVTAYQMKVSGRESSEIFVSRSERRFLAKVISPLGEQIREFRAGPGSILLDEEVAHQYYLLNPLLGEGSAVSLTVLSPRASRQFRMTFSAVGGEEILVGERLVTARHFRLEASGQTRDVWFDGEGRVLRVEIRDQGYVAIRESLR